MTGGSIRQVAVCPTAFLGHQTANRMAGQRTLAELLSNESIGTEKSKPLEAVGNSTLLTETSNVHVTYDTENSFREESGFPQHRADNATSDSPVQSGSLELAWRVVFAAEQRKAALMEHARPLVFRKRRSDEKLHLAQRETSDRPVARSLPPRVGLGGVSQFPIQVISTTTPETDCTDREEPERSRDICVGSSSREPVTLARRRVQAPAPAIMAEPNCGIAVSGQSLIVRRPTTPYGPDKRAQDGVINVNAPYPVEHGIGPPIPAFVEQADLGWQSLSGVGAQMQITASPLARLDNVGQSNGACADKTGWAEDTTPILLIQRALPIGRSTWTPHLVPTTTDISNGVLGTWRETSLERPRTSGETEPVATTDRPRTTGDSDHLASQELLHSRATSSIVGRGRELRYAPSFSDPVTSESSMCEGHIEGSLPSSSQVDSIATVEKGGSMASVASSARAARRTTLSTSHRAIMSNASRGDVVSSAPTSEPVSPQRPGLAIRRSRSMPAPRKNAEEIAPKAKLARSSIRQRALASGNSSSMPKSTSAAAAGAGAVAAKKRAKSKKLVLPFAYAEDDPRVRHVQSAEAPEARISQFFSESSWQ